MLLYNNTCLNACPDKTFVSTVTDTDNVTVIDVCVDCLPQCGSCTNNTSCSTCNSSGTYKYQLNNTSNNSIDCL